MQKKEVTPQLISILTSIFAGLVVATSGQLISRYLFELFYSEYIIIIISIVLPALFTLVLYFILRSRYIEVSKRESRIEQIEKHVKEHPKESKAAWDLAREKLESYLDRNLKQVR